MSLVCHVTYMSFRNDIFCSIFVADFLFRINPQTIFPKKVRYFYCLTLIHFNYD